MLSELKLVISQNTKIIETICVETSTHPTELAISLEKFRREANNAITKLIEDIGDSGGDCMDVEDEDESDEDEGSDNSCSSKRRKE